MFDVASSLWQQLRPSSSRDGGYRKDLPRLNTDIGLQFIWVSWCQGEIKLACENKEAANFWPQGKNVLLMISLLFMMAAVLAYCKSDNVVDSLLSSDGVVQSGLGS